MDKRLIFMIIFFLSLIYGANLFIVWTNQSIFNNDMTLFCYLIPLFIAIYVMIMFSLHFFKPFSGIGETIFSIFYMIFAVCIGYLLYIFLTSVILKIVDACVDIPSDVGIPILYGFPGIICIYGIINALITEDQNRKLREN